jgi:oxaloacetate decarboxylase beta subunit
VEGFWRIFEVTGLGGFTVGNLVMDLVGISFIYLAIKKHYEPLLLIPIGFGILLGNVPPIRQASTSSTPPLPIRTARCTFSTTEC